MKRIIITVIAILTVFCTNISALASNEIEPTEQENIVTQTETEVEDLEELSEQEEKAQERLVLILIIIGMVIALGTLYSLKYVAYKKENNK